MDSRPWKQMTQNCQLHLRRFTPEERNFIGLEATWAPECGDNGKVQTYLYNVYIFSLPLGL
jgi:hypothetical protein